MAGERSRLTKKATKMRKRRLLETSEQRNERLKKNRERIAAKISNESDEQRLQRLAMMRSYMRSYYQRKSKYSLRKSTANKLKTEPLEEEENGETPSICWNLIFTKGQQQGISQVAVKDEADLAKENDISEIDVASQTDLTNLIAETKMEIKVECENAFVEEY